MKTIARCVTALAVLAFATPALPCGDKTMKTTTVSAEKTSKDKVAKASKKDTSSKTAESKPATN